jgi:hypothetical protein
MKFRIDVFTAAGSGPSGGPITDVLGVSVSERLNQVGEVSFTIPAAVAAQRGLARGNKYRIYHTTLGYIGEFKHIESSIDASAETITIRAYDSLINLAERVAGFRRNFSNLDFSAVAGALFNTSLGWTVSYEGGTAFADKITYSVEGENYLRMADYLRKYVRGWFRREGDTAIRFGKFLSTTPVVTFVAAPLVGIEMPSDQAIITQIARTRAGGEIANRLYPVGAGLGQAKLDLRFSNRTTASGFAYPIQSTTISTSTSVGYYIEDTASIAQYGTVERVVAWNEIRPITNSAADLQNAGNALYDIASAYLQKYRNEIDAYTLTAVEVPNTLRVGDLVRVQYNGVAELENGRVGWLSVANNFWVTEIARAFDAAGEPQTSVSISANGEAVIGDTEVLYDILGDVQTLKLRTQPTQTYFSRSYDTIITQKGEYITPQFNVRFGPELLAINEMYCEINVRPLTYASAVINSDETQSKNAFSSSAAISTSTEQTGLSDGSGGMHLHSATHSHVLTSLGGHTHAITNVGVAVGSGTGTNQTLGDKPQIAIFSLDFPSPGYITLSEGSGGNTTIMSNVSSQTGEVKTVSIGVNNVTVIEGFVAARVNLISPTDYTQSIDWRNSFTQFRLIRANSVACSIHIQFYGRVTIQPIAV